MQNKIRKAGLLLLVFLLVGILGSCGKDSSAKSSQEEDNKVSTSEDSKSNKKVGETTIKIKDNVFLTQISDIYINIDDYKDKTIDVEGMFSYFPDVNGNMNRPVVYRKGPGCCGNDGWGGFYLDIPEDYAIPKENDWIEVKGTPYRKNMPGGAIDLYLKVKSIEIKDKRGKEFVKQ